MGVKDTVTAKYMRQNEIFADAFNYFIYGGEQVISPDSLEELDTREIDVPYGGEKGAGQPIQRTRDVIKSVIAMTDRRAAYLILAIENQSNIHYAMPVKNMVYDALQYAKQVEGAIASHKQSGDYKGAGSDEYLSGFMKADRLMPVVTLAVYFGAREWDGPMSIHQMFEGQDERVLALVPDYKINLIAPALMADDEFRKFRSTLKEVLSFIKYSGNADKLREIISADESLWHFGRNEIDVLNACVNANLTMNKEEEVLDVCQAIQTMIDRAVEQAEQAAKQAIEQAEQTAKQAAEQVKQAEQAARQAEQAVEQAKEQKRMETLLDNIKILMKKMGWSAEQSMDVLNISESDQKSFAQQLK